MKKTNETKITEQKVNATEKKESLTLEKVVIKQVSSPSTIARVAADRGINPQEVFVRIVFEYKGKQFGASNKLRFLTKTGYEELVEAQKNGTEMKISVNPESGFFYIEKDVTVEDLFKDPVQRTGAVYDLSTLFV